MAGPGRAGGEGLVRDAEFAGAVLAHPTGDVRTFAALLRAGFRNVGVSHHGLPDLGVEEGDDDGACFCA